MSLHLYIVFVQQKGKIVEITSRIRRMWWRLEIYVFELIKRARDGERASLPMASQMRISVCSFQFIDTPRPASTKGRWPENKNKKIYKIKNRRTQSHFIYNQSDMDSREKGTNKNISCWIFAYKKNTTTETAEWLTKNQPQNPLDGWKVFFYCSKKFFFFPLSGCCCRCCCCVSHLAAQKNIVIDLWFDL